MSGSPNNPQVVNSNWTPHILLFNALVSQNVSFTEIFLFWVVHFSAANPILVVQIQYMVPSVSGYGITTERGYFDCLLSLC